MTKLKIAEIIEKNQIYSKFDQIPNFFENLTKIEIF